MKKSYGVPKMDPREEAQLIVAARKMAQSLAKLIKAAKERKALH